MRNLLNLPTNLPTPLDDGGTAHLAGMAIPSVRLTSHRGEDVDLSKLGSKNTVLFIFPRAGNTIKPNPSVTEWDLVPGARGCTPQSCGFRDLHTEFQESGFQVFGLSVQSPTILNEVATKNHLLFNLLSDQTLQFGRALKLPTFEFHGEILLKRMALVIEHQVISKVFYPVFPPDRNAEEVLRWISSHKNRV